MAAASMASLLTPTQRYAAAALFALALRRAHAHQTAPFADDSNADAACSSWTHHTRGLLRPVFRFLGIDSKAWTGIEETAMQSYGRHHVEAFIKIIAEQNQDGSSEDERGDQELALSKAVDAIARSFLVTSVSEEEDKARLCEYERECRERVSKDQSDSEEPFYGEGFKLTNDKVSSASLEALNGPMRKFSRRSMLQAVHISDQRKVTILYELLSACVADATKEEQKNSLVRNGYDARHRVALRLLASWLDVEWIKMEAMEVIVACSAAATAKEGKDAKETDPNESGWSKWKRGGIIGAAALTGGALLAITGGLAAPAIAAGFGALAPTLGTLVPAIGASGFAAAASAAGSVAGSVAVAASFGAAGAGLTGTKVARRLGSVEEFEFVSIGQNHNQGRLAVGILISGLVFEQDDFVRPWDGREDNLERYVLQWESQNLIAVSTAIQDWITSRVALELMKHGAMMTVLSTLLTALAWPAALLSATDFIDSTWTIAIDRSDKAGVLLADVLMNGQHGNRPVTLCGFSLGARVIFKCLQHMAEKGYNEGIVERVVLIGAPIPLKDEDWEHARKLVSGRFINVYSTNDWMLGVAFRASLLTNGLAGIQPVNIPGIENVDVTELIDGHSSYLWSTKQLLEILEMDFYYPIFPSPPSRT